jgi:hypothetical protein
MQTRSDIFLPDSDFVRLVINNRVRALAADPALKSYGGPDFSPVIIARILNELFWISVARDESRDVLGAVALVSPEEGVEAIRFKEPSTLAQTLKSLLLAGGPLPVLVSVGADYHPMIWGIAAQPVRTHAVLRILEPAVIGCFLGPELICVHERGHSTDQKLQDAFQTTSLVEKAFGGPSVASSQVNASVALKVINEILQLRHGGCLIIAPAVDAQWSKCVNQNFKFSDDDSGQCLESSLIRLAEARIQSSKLSDTIRSGFGTNTTAREFESALHDVFRCENEAKQLLRLIGGLSAVDGAVVIDTHLRLLSFGSKLRCPSLESDMLRVDALVGGRLERCTIGEIGGTRHQSAARFVQHHNDAVALVASQDGQATLMTWETESKKVLALRRIHHMLWEYDSLISL